MVKWNMSKEQFKLVGAPRECIHEQGVVLGDRSVLEAQQHVKRMKPYFCDYAHISMKSLCWV